MASPPQLFSNHGTDTKAFAGHCWELLAKRGSGIRLALGLMATHPRWQMHLLLGPKSKHRAD